MKTLLAIATALAALSGCGAMFGDSHVNIHVDAPPGAKLTLDGQPVALDSDGYLPVDAHRSHMLSGTTADGKQLSSCAIDSGVQARYVVGDALLLEMVFPIVVDAVTGDWSETEITSCVLQ